MVKHVLKLVSSQFLMAHKVDEYARVEIPRTGSHGNTAGRSEPHRGVYGYSFAQSAEACSIPEVREDDSPGKLRAEVMHQRFIRKAVETITSNPRIEIVLRK